MTIKRRIRTRLQRSKRYVFTRDDFSDLAGYDQVGRVLRELVKHDLWVAAQRIRPNIQPLAAMS